MATAALHIPGELVPIWRAGVLMKLMKTLQEEELTKTKCWVGVWTLKASTYSITQTILRAEKHSVQTGNSF